MSTSATESPETEKFFRSLDRIIPALLILAVVGALTSTAIFWVVLGLAAFAAFVPLSSWGVIAYFVLVFGLAAVASENPISVGGIRVYGADVLAAFFAAWICNECMASVLKKPYLVHRPQTERRIMAATVTLAAYGLVAALIGLSNGHFMRDVLGDYRQQFYYPLALLLPLLLPLRAPHLNAVQYALIFAIGATALVGLRRFALGESWMPESYTLLEFDPRYLSSTELVPFAAGLAYFAVVLRSRASLAFKAFAVGCAGVAFVMLVISGWRLGILMAAAAPVAAMLLLTWVRREPFAGPFKAAFVLACLAVAGAALLSVLFPEEVQAQLQRTYERFQEFNPADDQRYYTWIAALETYRDHPILGAGLGHQLWFYMRSSAGYLLGATGTTHNFLLEVLYRGGLAAILLVLGIHIAFNLYVFRRLQSVLARHQSIVIGLYVGYASCFVMHLLEPNTPAGIATLYLSMGLIIRYLRDSDAKSAAE